MPEPPPRRAALVSSGGWLAGGAALAFLATAFPVADTDLWWHLASGRWILQARAIPDLDPLSSGVRGVPWVDVHWLFQVGATLVHEAGGVRALVIVKALVCAGALALLSLAPLAGRFRPLLVLCLVVALFAVRHLVLERPTVLTLLYLSVSYLVLERYRAGADRRLLALLPVVQVLWVNSQGLHPLGLLLVACFLAGAVGERAAGATRVREDLPAHAVGALSATLAACVAGSFVSPYGWKGLALSWKLLGRIEPEAGNLFSLNVSENLPPFLLERVAPGQTTPLTLFLLALALSFALVRRRLVLSRLVLACALSALALMANRNVLLLFWLGTPVAVANLVAHLSAEGDRGLPGALARAMGRRGVKAGSFGALAVLVAGAFSRELPLDSLAPFRVPTRSAEVLEGAAQGGQLFTSVRYGGYLEWRLPPSWLSFMDGRLVLRTPRQFAEYLDVVDHPRAFDGFRERHGFTAAVLPSAFPDRYLALACHLARHPDWSLAYTDGTELLFVFRDAFAHGRVDLDSDAGVDAVVEEARSRYGAHPRVLRVATQNLARLLLALERPALTRRVLAGLNDPTSAGLVARAHYLEGEPEVAAGLALRSLEAAPDDTNSLALLAAIALDRGRSDEALRYLERVLEVDPYNAQGRSLLQLVGQQAGLP